MERGTVLEVLLWMKERLRKGGTLPDEMIVRDYKDLPEAEVYFRAQALEALEEACETLS